MEELLTPVSQTYLRQKPREPFLSESIPEQMTEKHAASVIQVSSLPDAIEQLKSQPSYDTLVSTLKFVSHGDRISNPSPESAQIIQLLVSDIVPNYWPLLKDGETGDVALLLRCLQNVTGVNALVARMRVLIQEAKAHSKGPKRPDIGLGLETLLDVAGALLDGDNKLNLFWSTTRGHLGNPMKLKAMSHEFLALFAGGRIISVSAEADVVVQTDRGNKGATWIGDGRQYTAWLGSNIAAWAASNSVADAPVDDLKLCSDVLARALRLGYSDQLLTQLIERLLLTGEEKNTAFLRLFGHLPQLDQKRIIYAVIKYLAETHLNKLGSKDSAQLDQIVSAAAGIVDKLIGNDESRKNHLVVWLTSATGAGLGDGIGVRRTVLATLARDKEAVAQVLEKSLSQFGDQLYIKHSPILQQEAHAQVLLLAAGYVSRNSALKLRLLMRSPAYLHAISNRLEASQSRARFLGMVIGEALSAVSDTTPTKLDFKMEELDTQEAQWYKGLTRIADDIGPTDALASSATPEKPKSRNQNDNDAKKAPSKILKPIAQPRQSGFVIEEVEDSDEESEDEDLKRYAKPDSDSEDSDEDPTLIRRDKPKAPVYVRDLITYLRNTDSYDRQKLALTTAPSLIRRKANFGTEVSEHADELASLFVGLQDKFELENFYELRLQGMIALIVAQPRTMAPWFGKTFFDGDYSISQRASILVVMGLSARELAGFDSSNYAAVSAFPSKRLPERMEKLYLDPGAPGAGVGVGDHQLPSSSSASSSGLKAIPATALDTIAQDMTSAFLAPLAANAADEATGPNVLKLSSFTQRLDSRGQPKSTSSSKSSSNLRVRSIPNTTARLLSESFFAPLIARFQHALRSPAARRGGRASLFFQPHLLSLYLKTLALLVHAAGPSTIALPQMTAELWDLLLGVRSHVAGDLTSTHALLMALATMLEVNSESGTSGAQGMRRLCTEMPREVVETQEWVGAVFHNTRGDDAGGEENQVKMLAAGVLITLNEAMEKYRALLVGDMIGY